MRLAAGLAMWKRLARALGLVAAVAACGGAAAADTAYTVVIQGQAAGHLRLSTAADGATEADFTYRDNGRGPDLKERWRLDAAGVPASYQVQGTSTFGAEVREQFDIPAGRVRWTARIDQGDEAAPEGLLFLPIETSPAYTGLLAQALMNRPGRSAATPGGGRLVAEAVATITLDGPAGPVPLALVEVTGADAYPWYIWVRNDGSHAFFGLVFPGWAVLPAGHEALAERLVERWRAASDERLGRLRQRLALPLPGLVRIAGVRWFDAPAAAMRGPSDVWLHDGRITAVVPPGALALQPDHDIDGRGRTLLPGLWDMHAHLYPPEGLQHMAAGVTSVRNPASLLEHSLPLKQRLEEGRLIGPALHVSGFIEGASPFAARVGFVAESLDAALAKVDEYAALGLRDIKLYNSIRPEWVRPIAQRAHRHGLRVTGHVPAFMRAEEAVRAGYDELTHINQVMLNFVAQPGDDTRTLLRFSRVGDDARQVDPAGPAARRFIGLLRERGTWVDPTAMTFEAMYTQAQGQPNPSLVDVAGHLPAAWRRGLKVAEVDLDGDKLARWRASWGRMLAMIGAMHRAGVPLLPGTDGLAGIGLHRELALYVQAGIPAPEVLRIATWNPPRAAGESHRRGRIARGMVADLVLVDGDPAVRITDLHRASLVIQGRVAYAPARLYEAMGWKPMAEPPPVQPPLAAAADLPVR